MVFQGMIEKIMAIEQREDPSYKDEEVLNFELILDNNFYTKLKSLHICFPIDCLTNLLCLMEKETNK